MRWEFHLIPYRSHPNPITKSCLFREIRICYSMLNLTIVPCLYPGNYVKFRRRNYSWDRDWMQLSLANNNVQIWKFSEFYWKLQNFVEMVDSVTTTLRFPFGNVTFFTHVPEVEKVCAKVISTISLPKRDTEFPNPQRKQNKICKENLQIFNRFWDIKQQIIS